MRWENINEWRGFNYYFGNLHLDWNIKVWHIIVAIFVYIQLIEVMKMMKYILMIHLVALTFYTVI
jgi:hypothetical protein